MDNLLVLHASPRRDANSRDLTQKFIEQWSEKFPTSKIVTRDIGATPPEHLDDDMIVALRGNPESFTEHQKSALAYSDQLIEELSNADAIVIGSPMHNFTITAALRTYLDHIARPGKTFGYDAETGPFGMLKDKPVYVISTRGGQYGDGDPDNANPYDFQSGYIRHIFAFLGITNVNIIAANGMDMGEEAHNQGVKDAEEKIAKNIAAA